MNLIPQSQLGSFRRERGRNKKREKLKRSIALLSFVVVLLAVGFVRTSAQKPEKDIADNRRYGLKMLKDIKAALRDHYFDPTFHGLDLDKRFQVAADAMGQATSGGQVLGIVAQAV